MPLSSAAGHKRVIGGTQAHQVIQIDAATSDSDEARSAVSSVPRKRPRPTDLARQVIEIDQEEGLEDKEGEEGEEEGGEAPLERSEQETKATHDASNADIIDRCTRDRIKIDGITKVTSDTPSMEGIAGGPQTTGNKLSQAFERIKRRADQKRLQVRLEQARRANTRFDSEHVNRYLAPRSHRTLQYREIFGANTPPIYQHCLTRFSFTGIKIAPVSFAQQQLRRVGSNRAPALYPAQVGRVSVIKFDKPSGLLVASGASDGGLCVFRMEDAYRKLCRNVNKLEIEARRLAEKLRARALTVQQELERHQEQFLPRRESESEPGQTHDPRDPSDDFLDQARAQLSCGAKQLRPALRVETRTRAIRRHLQALEWSHFDPNKIACGFVSDSTVAIYDITRTTKNQACDTLSSGGFDSRTGHSALAFGTTAHAVFGGTMNGGVKLWDVRSPKKEVWETFVAKQSVTHLISGVLPCDNGLQLFVSSTGGSLSLLDIRKMQVPLMGTRKVPSTVWSTQFDVDPGTAAADQGGRNPRSAVRSDGIVSLIRDPHCSTAFFYQLQSGRVGLYDSLKERSLTSTSIQGSIVAEVGSRFQNVEREEAAIPKATLSARRNCLSQMAQPGSSLVCTGVPNNPALFLIDLSPRRVQIQDNWLTRSCFTLPLPSAPDALASSPVNDTIVAAVNRSPNLLMLDTGLSWTAKS